MIGYGNSMFLATHGILARSASGGGIDPDAQAFITAASITDPTQQSAINTLVTDLKGYGVWTKMKALYPFVGGTAAQHKWNLKDPRDLDVAFRLVFSGGITHSANGIQFGGVNGYADTFLTPSTSLSLNSTHFSYYSRTNVNNNEIDLGCQDVSLNYYFLRTRTTDISRYYLNQNADTSISNTDSRGLFVGNRQASNDIDGWKNGVKQVNGTTASTNTPNVKIFLGAFNSNGTPSIYSSKQSAFASIGDGLSDTEAANFYTAVQAFQTALSRQV